MTDEKNERCHPPTARLEAPSTCSYEAHPLAALMPMMDDDAFAQHKADIAKHGVRDAHYPLSRNDIGWSQSL